MAEVVAPNKVDERTSLEGTERLTLQEARGGAGSYFQSDLNRIREYVRSANELAEAHATASVTGLEVEADKITNDREAAHFLRQASLGVTKAEIDEVVALGSRSAWIAKQIASRFDSTNPMREWDVTPTSMTVLPGWMGTISVKMRAPETADGYTLGVDAPSNASVPGGSFTDRHVYTPLLRNRPQTSPFTDAQGTVWQDPQATLLMKCVWVLSCFIPASVPGGGFSTQSLWGSLAPWHALFARYAFMPYEELLIGVTYSPAMGRMLSHFRNKRTADGGSNQPDENYAREVMQLFTIGLQELNIDGTPVLGQDGQPIPTYTAEDVVTLSRVFTGLTRWQQAANNYDSLAYENANMDADVNLNTAEKDKWGRGIGNIANDRLLWPGHDAAGVGGHMVCYEGWHDRNAKYALNGLIDLPAETNPNVQIGDRDIKATIRALVRHPSCAPFVCKRLIKHMITSNPSPNYVARVARVFRNNGRGQVGDMAAVWTAILTDPEAKQTIWTSRTHGRVRYGFELWANNIRSFDRRSVQRSGTAPAATSGSSVWLPNAGGVPTYQTGLVNHTVEHSSASLQTLAVNYGSWIFYAPSIFGFNSPDAKPFPVSGWGDLVMPELESLPPTFMALALANMIARFAQTAGRPSREAADAVASDLTSAPYATILGSTWADAGAPACVALVERLNLLLCGGTLSEGKANEIVLAIDGMAVSTDTERENRVSQAFQMIFRATEFWVM
jgi:hypothetical protein